MNSDIVIKNFFWNLFERLGAQGVSFVVTIILGRLLEPEVYGTIALVTVITSILQIFIDSGLGISLVQKKDADDLDFSSVFYFNCIICIVLYLLLYISSPVIANFYQKSDLKEIIRVLGLVLIISGFKNILISYISKNFLFKKYFFATLTGTVTSAIVGIILALNGYGVWALVLQNVINQAVDTIILWFSTKWRPKYMFSFSRLRALFNYAWKIFLSSLLDGVWQHLNQFIIGKKYTTSDLAYYNKANQFPYSVTISITSSVNNILLPTMSKEQDRIDNIKYITSKAIKLESYLLWPMMIGLAACSDNLVKFLLTEKWMPIVPYLRVFCISYAFHPINSANLNAIKALGRSDIFLKLEIIKKISGLITIIISMKYGVYAMALGSLLNSLISQIVNSYPNKKLLDYRYLDQIMDIAPSIIVSIIMGMFVYCINLLKLEPFLLLIVQIVSGIIIYIMLSLITKNESYEYCVNILKRVLNKIRIGING